jgi:hypothetical protein
MNTAYLRFAGKFNISAREERSCLNHTFLRHGLAPLLLRLRLRLPQALRMARISRSNPCASSLPMPAAAPTSYRA